MTTQDLIPFEAETVAAEAAKCEAQRAAERHEREAKQAAKILAARQREKRKAEEEIDKYHRRWKREEAARKRNDILVAQSGINWYSRRRAPGFTGRIAELAASTSTTPTPKTPSPKSALDANRSPSQKHFA